MKIKLLLSILATSVLISGCSTMKEEKKENAVTNETEKDKVNSTSRTGEYTFKDGKVSMEDIDLLPNTDKYVIKPKDGADSIGLEFLSKEELIKRNLTGGGYLIQPAIDFKYEVSFYFINDKLEYAMYAPDKAQRWKLEKYDFDNEDSEFAKKFIKWNGIKNGIQRVDACRTQDGKLLLVELEDLNPYLSVLELDDDTREVFIQDLIDALNNII